MSTYLNAYEMIYQMRIALNEAGSSFMTGIVTSGAHHNVRLLQQLNNAQRYIHAMLKKRTPGMFRKTNSTLAVTDSEITLPADFGVLELLRDSSGRQIFPLETKSRKRTASSGSDRFYYREGNLLKLDKAGVTGTVELIYSRRIPELTFGQAQSASGAASLVMQSNAKAILDYYNAVGIENVTDEVVDTISDYTAARVATVAGTWAEDEWYGTISVIPEDFHQFIIDLAIIRERQENPLVQIKPTSADWELFKDQLGEAITSFGWNDEDQDPNDLFEDFDQPLYGGLLMDI